ncbi:MAG: hypothetical protein N2484_14720 [Clostridia bacterium]|nr:hypothetical protein [Clostridia bacterium]
MNFDEKEMQEAYQSMYQEIPENEFMPVETYLRVVKPQIVKKSAQLEQARKKRQGSYLVAAAYLIAMISIPCLLFDFSVNGLNGITGKYLKLILEFGILLLFCLPIMKYFLKKSTKGMN